MLNKIIDTISEKKVEELLNTEIKLYQSGKSLQVSGMGVRLLLLDGELIGSSHSKTKMGDLAWLLKVVEEETKKINLLIFNNIWFIDENRKRRMIECSIAWKLKY